MPDADAAPQSDSSSKTGLVADEISRDHDTGPRHPERPERFDAVMNALESEGLIQVLTKIPPRLATDEELSLCHTRGYVSMARRDITAGMSHLSTGDTTIGPGSLKVALNAAGSVLQAVDAVMAGEVDNAFCVLRPPGHHATPDRGMGFCIFNNVAIAARYAQQRHGVERVLIADWDVHHGNGTQDIFYEDPSVLFFSTHQSPWYPGTGRTDETGAGAGQGTTVNCPFPSGSGRDEILSAFRTKLLPTARRFRPDIIFISAGFDSRFGDPLGEFTLNDGDFRDLTSMMMEMAEESAAHRLISVLEGGYNLDGLGSAAAAHAHTLSSI